jgi:hypothetical protein
VAFDDERDQRVEQLAAGPEKRAGFGALVNGTFPIGRRS